MKCRSASSYLPPPAWLKAQWLSKECSTEGVGEQHRWARSDGLKAIVKCAGEWKDAAAVERRREGGCLRTHWRAQTGGERIFLDETGVTSLRVHARCVKCTNKSYKCQIYVTSRTKSRQSVHGWRRVWQICVHMEKAHLNWNHVLCQSLPLIICGGALN